MCDLTHREEKRQRPAVVLLIALAFLLAISHSTAATTNEVSESDFGKMPDGKPVKLFTLRNAKGMSVKVISYGAIITEIQAPDRSGAFTNVGSREQIIWPRT
jgi:aldose 1-epimerase